MSYDEWKELEIDHCVDLVLDYDYSDINFDTINYKFDNLNRCIKEIRWAILKTQEAEDIYDATKNRLYKYMVAYLIVYCLAFAIVIIFNWLK